MTPNYSHIALRLQKQMEVRFVPAIYRALRAQNMQFVSALKNHGLEEAKKLLSRTVMNQYIGKPIQDLHKAAGVFMARRVRQNIKPSMKKAMSEDSNRYITNEGFNYQFKAADFGFNERMVREIQEYFRIFLLEKAVLPISKTTIERINTVLDEAIEKGWGVDEIVSKLEGMDFRDMTRRRAEMIVRTEVVRASNFGGMAAAFDSDYEMTKTWVEVKDARTRLSHRHGYGVGGQVRDLLEPFNNGLQFPGDPEGSAKETINCRCTLAFRLKRDSHGRPILKTPMRVNAPYQSLANILAATIGFSIGNVLGNLITGE